MTAAVNLPWDRIDTRSAPPGHPELPPPGYMAAVPARNARSAGGRGPILWHGHKPRGARGAYGVGAKAPVVSQTRVRDLLDQISREAFVAIAASAVTPAMAARRVRVPEEVVAAFRARTQLISSVALGRLLRVCGAAESTVTRLVTAAAIVEEHLEELPVWCPPELDVADVELRITTCVELANVLLYLQERSGLPKLQLAIQSGIPRSQLYNLIDPERHALPRSRQQLYAFLRTCSLSERQTDLVLRQWDYLDQNRVAPASIPPDVVDLSLTPALREERGDSRQPQAEHKWESDSSLAEQRRGVQRRRAGSTWYRRMHSALMVLSGLGLLNCILGFRPADLAVVSEWVRGTANPAAVASAPAPPGLLLLVAVAVVSALTAAVTCAVLLRDGQRRRAIFTQLGKLLGRRTGLPNLESDTVDPSTFTRDDCLAPLTASGGVGATHAGYAGGIAEHVHTPNRNRNA